MSLEGICKIINSLVLQVHKSTRPNLGSNIAPLVPKSMSSLNVELESWLEWLVHLTHQIFQKKTPSTSAKARRTKELKSSVNFRLCIFEEGILVPLRDIKLIGGGSISYSIRIIN